MTNVELAQFKAEDRDYAVANRRSFGRSGGGKRKLSIDRLGLRNSAQLWKGQGMTMVMVHTGPGSKFL